MAMQGQTTTAVQGSASPKTQSLTEDGVNLVQRLHQILNGLESINDKLNGSSPRDVSVDAPEPQPSARRHMDKAHQLVDAINDEIQRIDSRL